MGKPQGDGLPDPVYYEREVDGETVQRPAYTPTDHVNLTARGWVPVATQEAAERPADAEVAEGEKPAGSQRRAAARVVPGSPVAAGEAGASSV